MLEIKDFQKEKTQPIRNALPKWQRNWKCYCGSGKKYKKCCFLTDRGYLNAKP